MIDTELLFRDKFFERRLSYEQASEICDNEGMFLIGTKECFADATYLCFSLLVEENALIVHGICKHRDGRPYAHAWCQVGDTVHTIMLLGKSFSTGVPIWLEFPERHFNIFMGVSDTTKYSKMQYVSSFLAHRNQELIFEKRYKDLTILT